MEELIEEHRRLLSRLADLGQLVALLHEDVVAVGHALSPEALWTVRAWVRANFALVEGGASAMGAFLVDYQAVLGWQLTGDEVLCLSDGRGTGDARRRRNMALTERVKGCFKAAERVLGSSCHVDFGGKEWPVFLRALEVRHRLMHPKASADLSVAVDEMQAVEGARNWFREAAQRFFVAGQARMQTVLAKRASLM